jgi:2-oxoglutarate ferredoxin oxidoreductase subunit alpha
LELEAMTREGISIALAGSGGSGVMTAGTLLLEAAARAGWYGLMVRTSGPQIRGGEAAALLRLGERPLDALDDRFDLLLALDWQNVHRFADELPLDASSLVVGDADDPEVPDVFRSSGARSVSVPMKRTAKGIPGSWPNMVALGIAGTLAGLPPGSLEAALRESWERSADALAANVAALHAGIRAAVADVGINGIPHRAPRPASGAQRWLISGNEAAGYGAIEGGERFVAA